MRSGTLGSEWLRPDPKQDTQGVGGGVRVHAGVRGGLGGSSANNADEAQKTEAEAEEEEEETGEAAAEEEETEEAAEAEPEAEEPPLTPDNAGLFKPLESGPPSRGVGRQ